MQSRPGSSKAVSRSPCFSLVPRCRQTTSHRRLIAVGSKCLAWWLGFALSSGLHAQAAAPPIPTVGFGKPAMLATADLSEFAMLPEDRRKLIHAAIELGKVSPWLPYTQRGSVPSDGGFDCSGAMYYVMQSIHLVPPRTASGQYQWLMQHQRLHEVPLPTTHLAHISFKDLHPGDLLFWGRNADRIAGTALAITHVAMYLGTEKKDRHPVMINSTDGRSYRGIKANGYGVYDFRLPLPGARIAFLAYGTPPGIAIMPSE
jgi:peptidoglycan DL-endopeptidase CwlO